MVTLITCHPWNSSFNHAIFQKTVETLEQQGKQYQHIDLYQDQFNPIFTQPELALYSTGESLDPLVEKYQVMLANTHELVLIFPIWWSSEPALLKGFFDKVLLKGFAFTERVKGKMILLEGLLHHIQSVTVLTTSGSPTFYLRFIAGNYVNKVIIKMIFKALGVKKGNWYNCGMIHIEHNRAKFLANIPHFVR